MAAPHLLGTRHPLGTIIRTMPLRKRQRINWENDSTDTKKAPSNGEPSSGDGGPVTVELSSTTELSPSNGLTTRGARKIQSNDKEQFSSSGDQGHRYGNFKNYYDFHPPANRILNLKEVLDHVVRQYHFSRNAITTETATTSAAVQEPNTKPPPLHPAQVASPCTERSSSSSSSSSSPLFVYCDVGCNEGDLTIELSKAILAGLTTLEGAPIPHIQVVGVDLDAELVKRATAKVIHQHTKPHFASLTRDNQEEKENENDSSVLSYEFRQADMTCLEQLEASIPSQVTLLSLFSTTMWLHIHAGDNGFREILNKLCAKTSHFFLVEPQPSKCYRAAMVRLRKAGLPELDVSSQRLTLRARIEDEIDTIMKANHFQSVQRTTKTEWNRCTRLYERLPQQPPNDAPPS